MDQLLFTRKDMLKFKMSGQTLGEWVEENCEKVERVFTINQIKTIVSSELGIDKEDMEAARRFREATEARQIAMFFCKKLSKKGLVEIGKAFSNKHHATVLHSFKVVRNLVETNPQFREKFKRVENRFINEKEIKYEKELNC